VKCLVLKSKNYHIGTKLISNTVYLFLDWLILSLFSFIFWMVLGKTLNPSDVGIVSTSINLTIFISGFSTLGITTALNKLIPEVEKKQGLKGVYSLFRLSFKPLLISFITTSLILLLFSNQISSFVKIPYYVFLICIFSTVIAPTYDILGSVLYGLQKMRKFFITDFILIFLRVLFAILLIFLGLSFNGPIIAFFLSYFFVLFLRFNPDYLTNGQSLSYKKLFSTNLKSF
jgi:O-antigen/teichoic acid export membrane protein